MAGRFLDPSRFWSRAEKTTTCWIWKGALVGDGYGRFMLLGVRKMAHRVAWELTHGPVPHGMVICHKCDNPKCVNPDHLFPAPQRENVRDMVSKGRARFLKSEEARTVKLTAQQVRQIRSMTIGPREKDKVAKAFGITRGNLNFILSGKTWKNT